jgi:hypothetical protein
MLVVFNLPRHPPEGLVVRAIEQQALVALIDSLDFAGSAAMLVGEAGTARPPCSLISCYCAAHRPG